VARIYVSSSYHDLVNYRRRAAEKIRELGHTAVGMEADGPREERPLDVCLKDVRECEGYFGIIGLRYGSSPPGHPDKSYTEMEYEAAEGKKRMLLVARPVGPVANLEYPYRDGDDSPLKPRLDAFRARLRTHSIGLFSNLDEFTEVTEKAIRTNFGLAEDPLPEILPHLCDRHDQERALEQALDKRLPQRPVLLVVHGDRREAQEQFIKRLHVDSLPKLLALPKTDTVSPYRLTWPETAGDTADMTRWLTLELRRVVMGKQCRQAYSVGELFRQMAATRMPTLVSIQVDGKRWGTEEMKPLLDFIGFWQQAPDFSSVQPLVVCLAISYPPAEEKTRWWQGLRARQPDPCAALATLAAPTPAALVLSLPPRLGHGSVTRQQVNNWLVRDVRPLLAELHLDEAKLQQRVDALFTEHETTSKSDCMPMGPLAERLRLAMHASRRVPTNGELFE
jgi:hypothetical protein